MGSPVTKAHMAIRIRGNSLSNGYYLFDWGEGTIGGRTNTAGSNCPLLADAQAPFRRMRIVRFLPASGGFSVLKEIFVGCTYCSSSARLILVRRTCLSEVVVLVGIQMITHGCTM
jgi:hypothetical protein